MKEQNFNVGTPPNVLLFGIRQHLLARCARYFTIFFTFLFFLPPSVLEAHISDKVYRNYNANGTFDTNVCGISLSQPSVGCCYRDASGAAKVNVSVTATWSNVPIGYNIAATDGSKTLYFSINAASGSRIFSFDMAAGASGNITASVVESPSCTDSKSFSTTNDCGALTLQATNQVTIIPPSVLSACNTDTVKVLFINKYGSKTTYPGPTTICLALPGNGQVTYAGGSLISLPSGASTSTADGATSLSISVPMPSLGDSILICFAVNSTCDVADISQNSLPYITGLVAYPTGFPVAAERVVSPLINAASANLIVVPDPTFNHTVLKGATWTRCVKIRNGGYGKVDDFKLYDYSDAGMTFVSASVQSNANAAIVPIQTVSGGQIIYEYALSGAHLGADKYLTNGEEIIVCAVFRNDDCGKYASKLVADYRCPATGPTCQVSDTLYAATLVQAGTPILSSAMVTFQKPNGCPDRHVKYRIFNSGTGAGFPESYAFDALFKLSLGNTNDLTINDLTLNGVSAAYSIAYNQFVINPNQFATDPDGAGGLSDLDGDGFFDDIAPGGEVFVEFDYTFSCSQLCGNSVFRNITATNTFTDYCYVLNGTTATDIGNFGFRQLSPISQTNVNYTCDGSGEYDTQCVTFGFDFEAVNYDLTNATARVNIFYSKKMTFEGGVAFNGVAKTVTIEGDSIAYFDLTAGEFSQLLTAGRDSLEYCQKLYCTDQRNTQVTNHYQILVSLGVGACASPCQVDLACNKHLAYGYNTCCGGAPNPCLTQAHDNYRVNTGWKEVAEINDTIAVHDRLWVGDTVRHYGKFWSNVQLDLEPFGVYPGSYFRQSIGYGLSTLNRYVGNIPPFLFQSGTFNIRKKSDNSFIKSMPVLLEDFFSNYYGTPVLTGGPTFFNLSNFYPTTCTGGGAAQWYCHGRSDYGPENFYENNYNKYIAEDSTFTAYRFDIDIQKPLLREGYFFNPSDTSIYMETDVRFLLNPAFPWDNVASVSSYAGPNGDIGSAATNDYLAYCNIPNDNFTVATHPVYISNPGAVYSPDCGLTVTHEMEFEGFNGDYFAPDEFRFPYRIDSIVVDLPTEYGLVAGTYPFYYHQSCAGNTVTTVVPSATTGHIVWTNPGGFPKSDDCAGYQHPYKLTYPVQKIGSAAPATYNVPIKIYGKDPYDAPLVLTDLARISEAQPALTLAPVSPITTITDGGNCADFYTDYQICNPSDYDGANVYFAIEDLNGTQITSVKDISSPFDPIIAADTSRYGSGNLFVKLGTVPKGTCRTVRVFHKSFVCSDSLRVYVDQNCLYPSPLAPVLTSPNLVTAYARYQSVPPQVQMNAANPPRVANLCDDLVVDFEISNARLPNLYQLKTAAKLPSGWEFVTGTAQYRYPSASGAWTNFPGGGATVLADTLHLDFSGITALNGACGLPGADEFPNSVVAARFSLNATGCPTANPQQITMVSTGESFCGQTVQSLFAATIYYDGDPAAQKINDFTVVNTDAVLKICAGGGEVTTIFDTLLVKNIGGHSFSSGLSSGFDTMSVVVPVNAALYSIANLAAVSTGWGTPWLTTDLSGATVLNAVVPAGIAVNATAPFIFKYDLTPMGDGVCAAAGHPVCYLSSFRTSIKLACAATNLDCGLAGLSVGNAIVLRSFDCCTMEIGDYVWIDTDKDGVQDVGETPISGIEISLFNMAGTQIASTTTDVFGKYDFRDAANYGNGFDTLAPNTMYFVVLSDARFSVTNSVLFFQNQYFNLTTANGGADDMDSDAATSAVGKPFDGKPNIGMTTGTANYLDHTFDFGFVCVPPLITSIGKDTATCTNGVANTNAAVFVRGIIGMAKYAYRSNATDSLWALIATASTDDSIRISNIANPSVSTTYTFRIWGTDTTCYNDTTVILTPSVCPPCSITATFTQGACNNNGSTAISADDYFTVAVSGVSSTNGGTSGKYEVVLNGTVLNTGGTAYGTSVTVGSILDFKSDGATTYNLTVRDFDIPTCVTTVFTTIPSAACSTIPCKPVICVPVTVTKN